MFQPTQEEQFILWRTAVIQAVLKFNSCLAQQLVAQAEVYGWRTVYREERSMGRLDYFI